MHGTKGPGQTSTRERAVSSINRSISDRETGLVAHSDVLGEARHLRAQAADPAHEQVDAHTGRAGRVQLLDHDAVDQEFAAYLPFYASCNTKYLEDEDVSNRPIRLFHGVADNWVPIAPCQAYGELLRRSGRDVKLFAYRDATHAFDVFFLKAPVTLPQAQTGRRCQLEERSPGKIVNRDSGQPFTLDDPCIERGTTIAYNPQAAQATKDVKEFVTTAFHLK